MPTSLQDYYNIVFWTNFLVYILYLVIKYPMMMISVACSKRACCSCELVRDIVITIFKKPLKLDGEIAKKPRQATNNASGKKTNEPQGKATNNEIEKRPKIALDDRSTSILFTLISTFGLLALGSALDLTLLSVTHGCTEDPNIDCYPRLIGNTDLNITIPDDTPIVDCSFWNSEDISDKVSIVCYQFVLNVELFLVAIGGLSTVFVFTMRGVIKLCLRISVCCIRDRTMGSEGARKKCLRVTRYAFVALTSLFEVGWAIMGMVLQGTGTNIDSTIYDTPGVIFLATHAAEILLIFGVLTTLLWLPWEDYAKKFPANS